MLLLQAKQIKKFFGDRLILHIPDLSVYEGDRIGIVGANGAGKTTLLNLLAGKIIPEEGSVQCLGTIRYFEQFGSGEESRAFPSADGRSLSQWQVKTKITQEQISGGEETRLRLAKTLSGPGNLLFLDEPTANLDGRGIKLLKELLMDTPTLLCISHDRDLLNQICSVIWEVTDASVREYPGNYENYEALKSAEREQQSLEYQLYMKEKKRLEEVYVKKRQAAERMTRLPKGMSPREARLRDFLTVSGRNSGGKQKSLNKSADNVKKRLEHMEVKEKPKSLPKVRINFSLTDPPQSKRILECRELYFSYENQTGAPSGDSRQGHPIFENASFTIKNRKKTAVLGDNGAGKTTLFGLMEAAFRQDEEGPFKEAVSSFTIAPKAFGGWLPQDFSWLKQDRTILENAMADSIQKEDAVRHALAGMLFKEDSLNKPASVLSGGEKMRLSFVKLFVSRANVLFLDEPTNFLDLPSIEALQRQVKEYEGTIVFISHDKEFIRRTADSLLFVENGSVRTFGGTYDQWEEDRQKKQEREQMKKAGGLSPEERMVLELRRAQLDGAIGKAASLEEKEVLSKEYWEVVRRLNS